MNIPLDSALLRKPLTVLIVDDDSTVVETFARMLKLEGYAVRTAASGEAGLHEAQVSNLDAILLDLRMPVVDGLAFLRELRAHEHQQKTPVAIVTGDYFLDDTVSNELRNLGAKVYFKPIWLDDLIRIAHALVNVCHLTPEEHIQIDNRSYDRNVFADGRTGLFPSGRRSCEQLGAKLTER